MIISYIEPEIPENAKTVSVKFVNDENNKEFVRGINVPYDSNNQIDILKMNKILEDHLRAVIYKHSIGLIEFVDPPFDL